MENDTIQYQLRTNTLTDWDILERLPELIDEDTLTYDQYIALQEFRILLHTLEELDTEDREQVRRLNKEINDLVSTPNLQELLKRGRLIVEAQARERDQVIYENYLRHIRGTPPKPEPLKQETVLKAVEMHDEAIKQKEKEQAVKAKQEARQTENQNSDKAFNYILFTTVLKVASLSLAFLMLDIPLFVMLLISTIIFLPAFKPSLVTAFIVEHTYNIARPILYLVATIIAAGGEQNFFTIAFYILAGIQAIYMIPRFIFTIVTIMELINSKF